MRHAFWTALILAAAVATIGAQSSQTGAARQAPQENAKKAPPSRTRTLTGCVERGALPNQVTIDDPVNGRYEVSGSDIGKYLGRRVRVAGTPGSTRFRIKGGLWPTPNVAAQGGAIDPGRAAVAAQPGGPSSGTGEIDLPTFKVKSIRTLGAACE
jgi:hypothetical protein